MMLLAAGLLAASAAHAEDERFIVRTAYTELIEDTYYLSADIEYALSPEAIEALENSVPLTVVLQVEIIKQRNWWWDGTVATLEQSYQIEFHPLSRQYVVKYPVSGEQESFFSYRAAIARLGQVSDLPVIDAYQLEPGEKYWIRMRAVLDLEDYSAPLRLFAFWSDWRISSEWYAWVLQS